MTSPDPQVRRVAILGAGNGGCAAACDLGRRGFEVRLFSRRRETVAPLQERGGVEHIGVLGDGFVPVPVITTDAAEAMDGADIVLLMGPTHAHESLAAIAAPHLRPDQIVMVAPGHTLLLVPRTLQRHGVERPVTCETATLPYICRMVGPAKVRVSRQAGYLPFAAFPGAEVERLAAAVRQIYPAIAPTGSVLETFFPYTNAVHHPPATVMNAGRIEATGGDYCHYYDGITPAVGRVIDGLDRERQAVGRAYGCTVVPIYEHFFRLGYSTAAARDSGSAYEVFHQSEPNRWIRAPSTLDHRFLNEDIAFGLVPLAELGRLAGEPTPLAEHIIELASVATGRDFRGEGLTLDRMGLAGVPRQAVQALLANGF